MDIEGLFEVAIESLSITINKQLEKLKKWL